MMPLRTAAATLLLTAVALLALPASGHAQIIDRFGVKVGVASASASHDLSFNFSRNDRGPYTSEDKNFGHLTGLVVSFFAERRMLPFLAVVGEVGYVQRGFTETPVEYYKRGILSPRTASVAPDASTRLEYLSIPVMAKLSYDLAPARLYALTGPRLDVLLRREVGEFKDQYSYLQSFYAREYDAWAVGGTAGAGISVDVGFRGRLLLEARYDFDVTDSLSQSSGDILARTPGSMRNNAVSVTIGVAF